MMWACKSCGHYDFNIHKNGKILCDTCGLELKGDDEK